MAVAGVAGRRCLLRGLLCRCVALRAAPKSMSREKYGMPHQQVPQRPTLCVPSPLQAARPRTRPP
jgi:hypothetical protein